jgi:hypothetical protein
MGLRALDDVVETPAIRNPIAHLLTRAQATLRQAFSVEPRSEFVSRLSESSLARSRSSKAADIATRPPAIERSGRPAGRWGGPE